MKLLHIDSSILAQNSASRALTAKITTQWVSSHPGTEVDYLDLAVHTPNHLAMESLGLRLGLDDATLTPAQRAENAISEKLVNQFLAANVVVIGAPLYNFSIPSQLKAWIDRIAQQGRTFTYTATGPKGLATGKTVIVASARGGVYSTSDAASAMEHQESYLKVVLGFMGVTDVRFVRAEGLAMGDDAKKAAFANAELEIKAATAVAANDDRLAKTA